MALLRLCQSIDLEDWRPQLDYYKPRGIEIKLQHDLLSPAKAERLKALFWELGKHHDAGKLEFVSCHYPHFQPDGFPTIEGSHFEFSSVDESFFESYIRLVVCLSRLREELSLSREDCVLNFHNYYMFPTDTLRTFHENGMLQALKKLSLEQSNHHTEAAVKIAEMQRSDILITNENNPPVGGGFEGLVDHAAEDMEARTSIEGLEMCVDLTHFMMSHLYFQRYPKKHSLLLGLETDREWYRGVPPSLRSLKDFLTVGRPLYFHLADCPQPDSKPPGYRDENHGLPVGEGTIDWTEAMRVISEYAATIGRTVNLVIEIESGFKSTEQKLKLSRNSEEKLSRIIEENPA